jgi:putative tricarboxylic transport membrane protein
MAYAEEIRSARDKSQFGKGNPVGVIASEMGNNACAMGDLIPTLSLGIPGSVGAAVFLGIMILFGVVPGYKVFIDHGKTIYGLFTAFFIENVLILVLGLTYAKYLAKITVIRNDIIVPFILIFSLLGSYSIRYSFFDLLLTSLFGLLGYFMTKYGYTPVPLVLALVLGPMLEKNFQRSLIIGEGSYAVFLQSGISRVLVGLTVFSLFYPYIGPVFQKWRKGKVIINPTAGT